MAIGSNNAIEYFGTQDTVITTDATVTDGSFSTSGQATTWPMMMTLATPLPSLLARTRLHLMQTSRKKKLSRIVVNASHIINARKAWMFAKTRCH